ncbi:Rad2 nuclease [Exophiala dermatitidis]|uniref:Exonuclease 1 n=2 Tax=Exophiala dermatitidis TaxID=5970 RepID=H6C2H6_EXODN|nr:exonuclease 1 [Exophiala dermatitidis NIH/UT8656]KAJ4508536.1 Rad2 nuclease [Exophiala dermatitidis]EHY58754.1 exonuclease 1 [Exophiala dermatitidis NIH/UT8656]KAJ4510453.1 Rad2 nuclease [Exophiala dermatitidis]KAJ4510613.1 Rad2 nuclease [Exophiala dermatitidis]KAJ4535063.1 Rad2 nuclease [Exophiala dermatitidis]
MGIKGLLPMLKSIQTHCTLKKFAGQTIGVDAYGWLHRGVVGCAFALALEKPTTIHIDFVLSRVRMLLDFGVTPYLVFDGDNIPSKAGTNASRRKKREEAKALGLELHKAGKTSQAHQELQKAVDVTPHMARQLIEELKKLNVQFVVAPYEADAQLVYLEQKGIIDGILSEDSDLLVFGAKRLLTKLNQYGELVEVERANFALCKEISLAGWTDSMFMRMAILSGCDYLPNIGKMGLKTAHSYVRKYKDVEKILRMVQLEGKMVVPDKYMERFQQAELTFLHHRVFCPIAQKMVHLNDLPPGLLESNMPYLGPYVDPDTSVGVACGDLDPFSKKPIQLSAVKALLRPALSQNRRQSYAATPGLKPNKSLETFFKPQRQPLAELDPNSLTPSPSQSRLLERHRNASWEPRLVSSAPSLRRSATHQQVSLNGADRSTFLARASTLSTYQPPKRPRLCSDSIDPSPTKEVKQSPFFSSKHEESSPLAQKRAKAKKTKKAGFEVFSDDSVNDQMLLECEIQQAASPEKSPAINCIKPQSGTALPDRDEPQSIPQSSPVGSPTIPSVARMRSPSPSRRNVPDRTPTNLTETRAIHQDDDPAAFEDLLDYHVRKQNEALLQKFTFQGGAVSKTSTCSGPSGKLSRTFSAQSPEVQIAALRKLPESGEIESFCKEVQHHKTFDQQSSERRHNALKSLGRQGRCLATAAAITQKPTRTPACNETVTPWDKAGLTRAPTSIGGIGELRGSEDAIVPNSEDEGSDIGSPPRMPRLDLSSFAFVST